MFCKTMRCEREADDPPPLSNPLTDLAGTKPFSTCVDRTDWSRFVKDGLDWHRYKGYKVMHDGVGVCWLGCWRC